MMIEYMKFWIAKSFAEMAFAIGFVFSVFVIAFIVIMGNELYKCVKAKVRG